MTNNRASFANEGSHQPDLLLAGDHPIRTTGITLASGQNITRGTVLGKITASGKYVVSFSAAADGSQVPAGIAAEDMDATGGDKKTVMYIAGDFNANALSIGEEHTVASIKDALAQKSIYLHVPLAAVAGPTVILSGI